MYIKYCIKCETIKPSKHFNKNKTAKDGLQTYCRVCSNTLGKQWSKDNKQKMNEASARFREKHPHKVREQAWKRDGINITFKEYEDLKQNQQGKCKICGRHEDSLRIELCVDHDHNTVLIRGLLCDSCNRGIGMLGDTPAMLLKAYKYLKETH